jgi:hypothetical protein
MPTVGAPFEFIHQDNRIRGCGWDETEGAQGPVGSVHRSDVATSPCGQSLLKEVLPRGSMDSDGETGLLLFGVGSCLILYGPSELWIDEMTPDLSMPLPSRAVYTRTAQS